VLHSGFPPHVKRHWVAAQYWRLGPEGNDIHKTNVPALRMRFRHARSRDLPPAGPFHLLGASTCWVLPPAGPFHLLGPSTCVRPRRPAGPALPRSCRRPIAAARLSLPSAGRTATARRRG
jgi:hypothetical protein